MNDQPPNRHLGITSDRDGNSRCADLKDLSLYEYRCPVTGIKYWIERQYTLSQHEPKNPPTGPTHADRTFQHVRNDHTEVSALRYAVTNLPPEVVRQYILECPTHSFFRDSQGHRTVPL